MTIRQRKRLIWALATVVALVAAIVLAVGPSLPLHADDGRPVRRQPTSRPSAKSAEPPAPSVSLPQLQRVSSLDLRRPLYDAPSAAKPAAVSTPAALQLRLVGTVIEEGHSMALFHKSDGTSEWCLEGQELKTPQGQVAVVEIGPRVATVRFRGKETELKQPEPPTGGVR